MERTQVLELMGSLKLYGMRWSYDEIMGNGIKRQHEPPRIVSDLLQAEISEKQARSISHLDGLRARFRVSYCNVCKRHVPASLSEIHANWPLVDTPQSYPHRLVAECEHG